MEALGVELVRQFARIDRHTRIVTVRVQCRTCWHQWPERQDAHGYFVNSGYYLCPKGCNRV